MGAADGCSATKEISHTLWNPLQCSLPCIQQLDTVPHPDLFGTFIFTSITVCGTMDCTFTATLTLNTLQSARTVHIFAFPMTITVNSDCFPAFDLNIINGSPSSLSDTTRVFAYGVLLIVFLGTATVTQVPANEGFPMR